jgi:predicted PurR-regulated permease PerM
LHTSSQGQVMDSPEDRQRDSSLVGVRAYRPFLLVVLFFSLYLVYLILGPFMDTLIFSIVIASLFYPLQLYLVRLYRGNKSLAALTIIFIITFLLVIPTFLFISALVSQGLDSINKVHEWLRLGNLQQITDDPRILAYVAKFDERFGFLELKKLDVVNNLVQLSKNVGQFLLGKGATLLGNVVTLVTHFFIMIFVVFYLARDGYEMLQKGRSYSPLRKAQEETLLYGIRAVAKSVLLGTFLTALCQGLVGGIGLSLVGIPGLFWGTVMGFASLIPIVGTALIWIPATAYLLLLGNLKSALFFALWSIILTGSIDNFLRPFLMRGEGRMSPFYIFLAIIGGVQYFGLAGILYGPLILSFAMIMLYLYSAEYRGDLLAEE